MNIGKMRFRVTLEKPADRLPNELGETTLSPWQEVDEIWAGIRPLSSSEIIRARQAQLDTTHKVEIRYYEGLTSAWRLRDTDGTVYNIKGVTDPTMLRVEMQLECVVSTDG